MSPDDTLSHMAMQWGQFLDHDLDFAMEAVSRQTFNDGITCRFGHFQTLLCLHCFYIFSDLSFGVSELDSLKQNGR